MSARLRDLARVLLGPAVLLAACTPVAADAPVEPSPGHPSWREVDGGADYYARFDPSLPAGASYFPIGVWLESVVDQGNVDLDRRAGLNTYVELAEGSDLALAAANGMSAMVGRDDPLADAFVLADEVDMWAGAGDAGWTGRWPGQGEVCAADGAVDACGYTIQQTVRSRLPADGLTYANYGKGVGFWLDDADARAFVNRYQDVVSVDTYWFTDPNICSAGEGGALVGGARALTQAECRRAANYGWTVDHVRSLVEPRGGKPVWAFVELGHPFSEDSAPTITGPQVRAAVWSSVIHGARGIVYFNHSFGGSCESFHLLREPCGAAVRPWVVELNRQLTELAPVLNAPFLDGAVTADGSVDTAVKVHEGVQYLFAASTDDGPSRVRFRLRCAVDGIVAVLGEDREVGMEKGVFADRFEGPDAVHVYRYDHAADAAPGCAPA